MSYIGSSISDQIYRYINIYLVQKNLVNIHKCFKHWICLFDLDLSNNFLNLVIAFIHQNKFILDCSENNFVFSHECRYLNIYLASFILYHIVIIYILKLGILWFIYKKNSFNFVRLCFIYIITKIQD